MGIIGSILKHTVGKAVAYKATEVGIEACDKAQTALKSKNKRKVESFFEAADSHARLILTQKPYTFKESFQIFDENQEVKYVVKGKLASATHHLSIYDKAGKNKLGEVKEKLIAWRSPFSMEAHPQDFIIELNGKKIGKIKSRFAFGKRKFEFDFNGWIIEGNVLGFKYKVLDGKDIIMEVGQKLLYTGDTYFIDITNPENELLCLMIALAIDSSHTSKSSDNKRARRHLF